MFIGKNRQSGNRTAAIVNLFMILGATFAMLYTGIEMPLITPPRGSFCTIYHHIKIVAYAMTVFSAYFALWYRVFRLFYRNKILMKRVSKVLQVINVLAFFLLFLMVISNLILFLSAPTYVSAGCGCQSLQNQEDDWIKWAVLFACTTAFQTVLLFLFIYPLYMHRKIM